VRVYLQKVLSFVCLTALLTSARAQTSPSPSPLGSAQTKRIAQRYGQLPLAFEVNEGQVDRKVKFLSRGAGYNLFLTSTEAVLILREGAEPLPRSRLAKPEPPQAKSAVVRMKLLGVNAKTELVGQDQLQGTSNYFVGNDPKRWHTGVPQYSKVRYVSVYPGVDLLYYGKQQELEYDFVLRPGANLSAIRLRIEGAKKLWLDRGDLVMGTAQGNIRLLRPYTYQEVGGRNQEIRGHYVMKSKNEVGFSVPSYDRSRTLIIDPVLAYSSYLGGSQGEVSLGLALDSSGNAYVTGYTVSADFPTTNAIQPTYGGAQDAFVSKINRDGSALVYSTFLGGTSAEFGLRIALDSARNAYIFGQTFSPDFPVVNAIQPTFAGGTADAFVTKISAAGNALVYSTYLGGSGYESTNGAIAVDKSGQAYVTGTTFSTDFPTANALQPSNHGGTGDAFITKINPAGTAFVYSTYLGGTAEDDGVDVAVDSTGNAYIAGETDSTDFPVVNAIQPSAHGSRDVFVAEMDAVGSALVYSTYLGGTGYDSVGGIAVDATRSAYVIGTTRSLDFPVVNAFQPVFQGNGDAFVTKINGSGSALVYSTYLGGTADDFGYGIAVDSKGNAYATGCTNSADFPLANAIQPTNHGHENAFVAKINSADSGLIYSTYLGGNRANCALRAAVGAAGTAYITGYSNSTNFPTTAAAFQPTFTGGSERTADEAVVIKIASQSLVSVSQPSVGFYKHTVGTTSAPIKRTLTNHGMTAVTIRKIYITGTNPGDFAETNNCGAMLAAGAKCTISITFTPLAIGARRAAVAISDSDPGSPQAIALMGTGG
jgi:hypothetical protein